VLTDPGRLRQLATSIFSAEVEQPKTDAKIEEPPKEAEKPKEV
jgi:hypothetical protein